MPDLPVGLVLDASAIIAFTQWSIHVGEVLTQVAENGAVVGLPIPCLVEAAGVVTDTDRLDFLVSHPTTALVADDPESWRFVRAAYDLVGRYDSAVAAVIGLDLDVAVLTRHPELYASLDQGGLVIGIVD